MKNKVSKKNSLDHQVASAINFMSSHEWAGPLAIPINLHEDLDKFAERYLFDAYIDLNYAYKNYKKGDITEAKRRLGYSLIWKDEAIECSYISGTNDFSTLLFKKTEEYFDNVIHEICSDEISSEQKCNIVLEDIKVNLKNAVEGL